MTEFELNHTEYRRAYDRAARLRAEALRSMLLAAIKAISSLFRSSRQLNQKAADSPS